MPRLYRLTGRGEELVKIEFNGERAGGLKHRDMIKRIVEDLRQNMGVWTWIDTGKETSMELPDIMVVPPSGYKSLDLGRVLFIEVETWPSRDPGKIRRYIERARKSGAHILFVVDEKYLGYMERFGVDSVAPDGVVDAVKRILAL